MKKEEFDIVKVTRSEETVRRDLTVEECIFCDEGPKRNDDLHSVQTMGTDEKIRKLAKEMSDGKVLGRISPGDLVALEAVDLVASF